LSKEENDLFDGLKTQKLIAVSCLAILRSPLGDMEERKKNEGEKKKSVLGTNTNYSFARS
jgi:hypothetical protein